VGISRDVTERRRAEEERRDPERRVQHAQKLETLGMLAGGVAHDLNNLLVAMLGHSSLALAKLSPDSPARHNIENVVQADPGQIQQVVMNLVVNGAEAIGDRPGSLIVRTGLESVRGGETRYSRFTAAKLVSGRYVFLEIRDDGSGMDERTQSQIVEPFFSTSPWARYSGRRV
jgi:signal transduction histidine kinase